MLGRLAKKKICDILAARCVYVIECVCVCVGKTLLFNSKPAFEQHFNCEISKARKQLKWQKIRVLVVLTVKVYANNKNYENENGNNKRRPIMDIVQKYICKMISLFFDFAITKELRLQMNHAMDDTS